MPESRQERPYRLGLVAQFPIHYHLPLYRALAEDPDIDLQVLFMQRGWSSSGYDPEVDSVVEWGVDKFSGYPHRVFPNVSPRRDGTGFWKFVNPGLIGHVMAGPYDGIYIHGHNHFSHVACALAAKLGFKRLVLRTISNNLGTRAFRVRALRQLLYRPLYWLFDRFLYTGAAQHQYYRDFGVPERKLVHAPHIVDNAYFRDAAARLEGERAALKEKFGIPAGNNVLLTVAKIRPVKNPIMLVEAFAEAAPDGWTLLWAGSGEMEAEVRAAAKASGADVVFGGFLDQTRVPDAYAVADLFALSSWTETWGLVVNEALNFGLPSVVTDGVGCAPDLVEHKTGLVVPAGDTTAMADALRRLMTDDGLRATYAAGAQRLISGWGVDEYVAGLKRALGIVS
ncbi:MAG: glycosyltransferase family 4 protein [Alphaproteobacteria bacterium]|nr:glycosyltransferase family 4 protein [Alphaproteobacteria bacterium]